MKPPRIKCCAELVFRQSPVAVRWHALAFRSFSTVTLLLLDWTCQFGLSRLMASKPSNRLAAQLWGASDVVLEGGYKWPCDGRCSEWLFPCRDPDCEGHGPSNGPCHASQLARTGSEMGSNSHCGTPHSVGMCRGEGVARGAPRTFDSFTERTLSCTKARSSLQKLSWSSFSGGGWCTACRSGASSTSSTRS